MTFFAVPVAERLGLKKELQQLYKIRSKLSHGGLVDILPEDLYRRLCFERDGLLFERLDLRNGRPGDSS